MGIIHSPRTAIAIARGYAKRLLSPLTERERSVVGMGPGRPPHVYSSRAGAFDVDVMLHMNNASYLTHAELARWEWMAFGGQLASSSRTGVRMILAASTARFRREVRPFRKFDVETRIEGLDDRNMWIYQTFHNSSGNERGKVLAQVFSQAVMVKDRKVVNPISWAQENILGASDVLDDLITTDSTKSAFDEMSRRFIHLEESFKTCAALHDDKFMK